MSTHRHRHLDRDTAEQLLHGMPPGSLPRGGALASLLAAAAAPARGSELRGEEEAATAFREAHLAPATEPRRSTMKTGIAKLLTVKAAALTAAGVTAGGVALAAGTGHLPSQLGGAAAAHSSASAAASHSPSGSGGAAGSHPNASPSPSLRGLCHAYTAGVSSNPGKALANPAFSALIAAAGGKDKVTSYCARVLTTDTSHSTTSHAAAARASHPAGKPSDHPTGKPSSHPTGRPAAQ